MVGIKKFITLQYSIDGLIFIYCGKEIFPNFIQ